MIVVIADIYLKEGKQEEFLSIALKCVEGTVKEAGNISYELKADVSNKNKFTFIETWESLEALDLHKQEEHYKAFSEVVAEIREKPAVVSVFDANKLN